MRCALLLVRLGGLAVVTTLFACGGSKSTASPAGAADTTVGTATAATISCKSMASGAGTRAALFAKITSKVWGNQYCNGNCTSLTLSPDGTYQFAFAEGFDGTGTVPAHVDHGAWNFAEVDDSIGLLCLDGAVAGATRSGGATNVPSVLWFSSAQYFTVGNFTFEASGDVSGTGTEGGLPDVAVAPTFAALASNAWSKTNAFDLDASPDAVTFTANGYFNASYRNGQCRHGGHISLDRDTLYVDSDQNPCGAGGNTGVLASGNGIVPGFFDDVVVLGNGTYRKTAAAAGKPNEFVFDPYGHSVRVHGSYDGVLKAGVATTLSLTFENTDVDLTRTLRTFSASLQAATLSQGQPQTSGPITPLATMDLGAATLAPGQTSTVSVTVTPPAAGDTFAFAMRLVFDDSAQKYDGSHTYLTAITP